VAAQPPFFVVVSGLAGSGKTSVAAPLADALGVPMISKDLIKEALFDAVGTGDWEWSKMLSRAADAAMVEIASRLPAAVLDNYWYAETVEQLLAPLRGQIVEVCCCVDPSVARTRLQNRRRHPGHADERAPTSARDAVFKRKFPLGVFGPAIEVDTTSAVDVSAVAAEIVAAIPDGRAV
jgi:predicted kinase